MPRVFVPFLLILLALPCLAERKPPPRILVLANVTVIDVGGGPPVRGLTVVIYNDRIEAISKRAVIHLGRNVQVVNAAGKFLIPGLWDMHVHIPGEEFLPWFLAHGVTGVRDMGNDLERVREWRQRIAEGRISGPRIVAAGPILNGPPGTGGSGLLIVESERDARQAVSSLKNKGANFVKVHSRVSREAFFAIADEAKKQGLPVAGHVPVALNALEASDAGQKSIEHLSEFLLACSTQEAELRRAILAAKPGPDRDRLRFAQVSQLLATYSEAKAAALFRGLKKNGTWQVPTLIVDQTLARIENKDFKNDPRFEKLPASWKEGMEEKKQSFLRNRPQGDPSNWQKVLHKDLQMVAGLQGAGVPLMAGTDTPVFSVPGMSLHDELELLVAAGLTPMQVLQAATLNPARFLGQAGERGVVEKGRVADLVLLDANPLDDIRNTRQIYGVVKGGKYFSRRDLDKMLADLEKPPGDTADAP